MTPIRAVPLGHEDMVELDSIKGVWNVNEANDRVRKVLSVHLKVIFLSISCD